LAVIETPDVLECANRPDAVLRLGSLHQCCDSVNIDEVRILLGKDHLRVTSIRFSGVINASSADPLEIWRDLATTVPMSKLERCEQHEIFVSQP